MEKFPESKLAHKYLDGLSGLEIGGSIHNPFGLNTKNVDYTDSAETVFKREEMDKRGAFLPVDIVAPGDNIPVPDASQDFVISSHVLEHFPDPIGALKEWYRVIKEGGYIFMIIPHKERTFDRNQNKTTFQELLERHKTGKYPESSSKSKHYSCWITEDFIEFIKNIDLDWQIIDFRDVDDKVGNGFTIVIRKSKPEASIKKEIDSRLENLKKQHSSSQKVPKSARRLMDLINNSRKEYRRNGLLGICKRIATIRKWDN